MYSLRACELGVAASSICTNGDPLQGVGGKSVVFGPNYAGNGNLTAEGLNSSALYQPWDDKKNYAYPPMGVDGKTLTIGRATWILLC